MDNINELILEGIDEGLTYQEISEYIEETIGEEISPEAIRSRIRRMNEKKSGKSSKPIHYKPKDYNIEIEKKKIKYREQRVKALENRVIDSEARFRELVEVIEKSIVPLEFNKADSGKNTPINLGVDSTKMYTPCLLVSDLHFGKKTENYDLEKALERLDKLFDDFCNHLNQLENNNCFYNDVHIFLAGDLIDGESIYPTHPHHITGSVLDQVFSSTEPFVEKLERVSKLCHTLHVHSVRGNHGRLSKFANEKSNFDTIYSHILRVALREYKNIKFNISDGWHLHVDIDGLGVLMYHGHQIKMTLNLPWYGVTTRVSRWATTGEVPAFDIALQGHFHTSSKITWGNRQILLNGTMVDGDQFALENLGLESSQSQWCFTLVQEENKKPVIDTLKEFTF